LPWDEGWPTPEALDERAMAAIEADFVQAARRALRLDVAGLEVHAAHGYLLAGFLSPLTNVRTDAWGGSVQARLRFPMQVIRAVRSVWPAARPLSVRLSLCDWVDGGLNEEDALAIGRAMRDAGVDLVSVSTGQTVAHQQPRHGRMWQMPFAELLKKRLGLRVMGVGAVTTSGQVNALLHAGKSDLVALGRPWLADPFWMRRQAALDGVSLPGSPAAYAAGWDQVERQARQTR
jgi:anthraniloyl-CoA monooxygenase